MAGVTEQKPPRTATDVVVMVENQLGWDPNVLVTQERPLWRVRAVEAGKLNAAMKRQPRTVTLENLGRAVDYCRRHKIEVKSPYGVVYHIKDALAEVVQPPRASNAEVEAGMEAAIRREQQRGDAESAEWVARLTRAVGPAREDLLNEWRVSRG